MMYDELVKNLRECWDDSDANVCDCDKCMFKDKIVKQDGWADYSECEKAMCLAAADAIEKLSAYTELYKDLAEKNQQMARKLIEEKPRWIPVTERLPREGRYLALTTPFLKGGEPYARILRFAERLELVDKYDFGELNRSGWYYYDDEYGHIEVDTVTHWMPLPGPPEEGK